jgi:hypothetical protein
MEMLASTWCGVGAPKNTPPDCLAWNLADVGEALAYALVIECLIVGGRSREWANY